MFLVAIDSVVERRHDVEHYDQRLQHWPVPASEGTESEVLVVHLKSKPRPFHSPSLALVLMEVLERLSFFASDDVVLGVAVQGLLYLVLRSHFACLVEGVAPEL